MHYYCFHPLDTYSHMICISLSLTHTTILHSAHCHFTHYHFTHCTLSIETRSKSRQRLNRIPNENHRPIHHQRPLHSLHTLPHEQRRQTNRRIRHVNYHVRLPSHDANQSIRMHPLLPTLHTNHETT